MEEKLERGENTGVIIKIRPEDFFAGAESGLVYKEELPSGDWEPWKPTDEWQRRKVGSTLGYDTNSCITFSALNSIEIQIRRMYEQGIIPSSDVTLMRHLGYFDENGLPNFSDWFSSIVDGTTVDGNWLQAPWDSFRKDGILPQRDGREVNDFKTNEAWLDPANITSDMRAKAKMFLEIFDIKYEWVVLGSPYQWEVFDFHVKQAPLHIVHPTCTGWNTKNGIVPICPGVTRCNHATLYLGKTPDFKKDLDHYDPFVKHLANDYYIPYALKGVVSIKEKQPEVPSFHYTFNVNLKYGMGATAEVHKLQEALQNILGKDGQPYMKPGVFGIYGPITRTAVGKFQTDKDINDPDGQGTNFGPQTRKALNAITA